jgi:ubiquinone/menaquinone biosynthesis C-methylase UbiE
MKVRRKNEVFRESMTEGHACYYLFKNSNFLKYEKFLLIMRSNFITPCAKEYGCNPQNLESYSSDSKVNFVRCNSCGLIWKDIEVSANGHVFDSAYFEKRGYGNRMERRIQHSHLFLAMLEQFGEPGTLLEVGPGLGESLMAASERGWQAQGLDISEYVTNLLSGKGFRVTKGSLGKNDIEDDVYDSVFMKQVIEHYANPFEALADANRILRQGGLIQLITPNADYSQAKKSREKHRFYRYDGDGAEHFVYFTQETLRKALEHTGFEVLQYNVPFFLRNSDSISQNLEVMLRRVLPFLGARRELMMIARKFK